jgi:hypothetical protein
MDYPQEIDISKLDNVGSIDFKKVFNDTFIDVRKKISYPPTALSIGLTHEIGGVRYPIPFGTYGNFSCFVGASKSKKSFLKSLFMACYIGGNANNYAENITTHLDTEKFIIDIDTEQSEWHSQNVFKRVPRMVGDYYENYKPFYLRKYDHKERLQFIEYLILESEFKGNIGLVSIDGFADLVSDVNDLEQANNLTQKLLKWTDISQCHLTGILHANYGSDKPTGHLGSSILKKAETVCNVTVDEQDFTTSNVKFTYTRGFSIDEFSFTIDNEGLPVVSEPGSQGF